MKSIKIIISTAFIVCLGAIALQAQGEKEAMIRILKELTLEEKKEVLDFAKRQESDLESEILDLLSKLPHESQISILEYAHSLTIEREKEEFNPNIVENSSNDEDQVQGARTTADFKILTYDFGTAKEGEVIIHTFAFENTGKEPLIISKAKGSCGCTVPSWPKEPIAPGERGEVIVRFNTNGKAGKRNQQVTLIANTSPTVTTLSLQGTVTPKDKE